MKTVYEKRPDVWGRLEAEGYKNIADVARQVGTAKQLGKAVGLTEAAVSRWVKGYNKPGFDAEHRAGIALRKVSRPEPVRVKPAPVKPAPEAQSLILVRCDPAHVESAILVLEALGHTATPL